MDNSRNLPPPPSPPRPLPVPPFDFTVLIPYPSFCFVIPLNLSISIKLTNTNYLTWQSQLLPIIHGYNLFMYIDSTPPPKTIPSSTGTDFTNPDYLAWHRQDELLDWILSSLTKSILARVVSCSTTLISDLHFSIPFIPHLEINSPIYVVRFKQSTKAPPLVSSTFRNSVSSPMNLLSLVFRSRMMI